MSEPENKEGYVFPHPKDLALAGAVGGVLNNKYFGIGKDVPELFTYPIAHYAKRYEGATHIPDHVIDSMISDNDLRVKIRSMPADIAAHMGKPDRGMETAGAELDPKSYAHKVRGNKHLAGMSEEEISDGLAHMSNQRASLTPGYNFRDGFGRVSAGGRYNNSVLMHELGHAQSHKAMGDLLYKVRDKLSSSKMPAYGLAGAAVLDDDTRKYAPAIAMVPGLTDLAEEGRANYYAAKHLNKTMGGKAALGYLGRTASRNMLGYVHKPALVGLSTAAMADIYGQGREKAIEEKRMNMQTKSAALRELMSGVEKMAAEGADEYTPHYLRNAAIGAGVVGVPTVAAAAPRLLNPSYRTLRNSVKDDIEYGMSRKDAVRSTRKLFTGEGLALVGGVAGLAGAGLALGGTALNHARHSILDKQASNELVLSPHVIEGEYKDISPAPDKSTTSSKLKNFVSKHKVPLAMGGALATAGAMAYANRSGDQTKQASWQHTTLDAMRDFGVIGAADLAALAAYDHIHRNDPAPAVRVEYPENAYLQKVAEQLDKEANLISTIANGAKAAWGAVRSKAPTFAGHAETGFGKVKKFANDHPIATAVGASVAVNKALG